MVLNWPIFWNYIKKRGQAALNLKRELLAAVVLGGVVLTGSVLAWPPFHSVVQLHEQIKDSWGRPRRPTAVLQPNDPTLRELVKQMDLAADEVIGALESGSKLASRGMVAPRASPPGPVFRWVAVGGGRPVFERREVVYLLHHLVQWMCTGRRGERRSKQEPLVVDLKQDDVTAQVVRLHVPARCSFALDEVEVYAVDDPEKNIALKKPGDQISVSPHSHPGTFPDHVYPQRYGFSLPGGTANRKEFGKEGGKVAFSLRHSGDVLHRAEGLRDRLRGKADPAGLRSAAEDLQQLHKRLAALEAKSEVPVETRKALYMEAPERSPAKFGAQAAPLMKYLQEEHYGVNLPPEDFERITLWLDCNSEFLGAYEDDDAQIRGKLVQPSLE